MLGARVVNCMLQSSVRRPEYLYGQVIMLKTATAPFMLVEAAKTGGGGAAASIAMSPVR